jgi:nitrogen regulatory protein PII
LKLLVFVLNENDKLEKLLKEFSNNEITGATIINSKGMARVLLNKEFEGIFGSLRYLINGDKEDNKTIFMAVKDEMIQFVIEVIEKAVGSLDEPDTGILFTIPIDYIRGFKH